MRLTGAVLLFGLALAAPAAAQEQPADPIGALLDRPGQATPETEEPDTAGQSLATPEPEPTVALPAGPQPYVAPPRRPQLTEPTYVGEVGKSPDAPPTVRDLAYESRMRSSFASAQGFQGPLDGSWTLASASGGDLYALELRDRGNGVVEGAWRDLRRAGTVGSSGFVDEISRAGSELTLRFSPDPNQPTVTASLRGGADGRWSGDLSEHGARQAVSLRRSP
ncbi:MAG: hypothetical protein ABW360_09200 [Phenylobacterium sp.]